MDAIQAELDRLNNKSNLSKAITDIDKCLTLLENARNNITQGYQPLIPMYLYLPYVDVPDRSLIAPNNACTATAINEYAAREGWK